MSHNDPRCGTCKYAYATSLTWECRRLPPALVSTVQGTTQLCVGWPEVRGNTFCGEWAARAPVLEPVPVAKAEPAYRPSDYLRLRLLLAKVLWGAEATEGLFNLQTPEGIADVVEKRIRTLERLVDALRAVRDVP